jgi:hypothetical protein
MDANLALTDDEAAAVAVLLDGAWRTPLPTVDERDESAVAGAILRGRRSLYVRELADEEGTPQGTLAALVESIRSGPVAAFQLVDAEGNWVPRGFTLYLYGEAPDSAAASHVLTLSGVHYFRTGDPGEGWGALTELAEAYFTEGFDTAADGEVQPAGALLSVVGPEVTRTVRVARSELGTDDNGLLRTWSSVSLALSWLTEVLPAPADV